MPVESGTDVGKLAPCDDAVDCDDAEDDCVVVFALDDDVKARAADPVLVDPPPDEAVEDDDETGAPGAPGTAGSL